MRRSRVLCLTTSLAAATAAVALGATLALTACRPSPSTNHWVAQPSTSAHRGAPSPGHPGSAPGSQPGRASKSSCVVPPHVPVQLAGTGPQQGFTPAESHLVPPGRVIPTFDDWPWDGTDKMDAIREFLKQRGDAAIFALIGQPAKRGHRSPCAKLDPAVMRLYQDGFYVINHSWSHPPSATTRSSLPQLLSHRGKSHQRIAADRQLAAHEIADGVTSNCFRPPYGYIDPAVRQLAAQLGFRICGWSYDSRDWTRLPGPRLVADARAQLAREDRAQAAHLPSSKYDYQLKDGAVLLFHLVPWSNIFPVTLRQVRNHDPAVGRTPLAKILDLFEANGLRPCRLVQRPPALWQTFPYPFTCN